MMSENAARQAFLPEQIYSLLRQAGQILFSRDHADQLGITQKEGCANFVTEYDFRIQKFLKEEITKLIPNATFFAEESDGEANTVSGVTVYLDPIDGTSNFIHGGRECSLSLAIAVRNEVCFGAVYLPYQDELFAAEKGRGATLNGKPIHVSERTLDEGLISVGTAFYHKQTIGAKVMKLISDMFFVSADIRRYGSAALEMCYVACGRVEASFEYRLYPWDYAAGSLIVTEAGGVVSTMQAQPLALNLASSMLCANRLAYDKALQICRMYDADASLADEQ